MSLSPAVTAEREADETAIPAAAPPRGGEARRFAVLFALLVVGPLAAQAGFNWLVNPWGLYTPRLVKARVVDERHKKCALLEQFSPPPTQLLLGTSRVMRFEPAVLEAHTGLRTFNAAIPGAVPVDLLVLYRFATEQARAPLRRVILGLDSLIFFGGQGSYGAIENNPQLRRYLPERDTLVADVGGLALLLSPAQTADAWASLRHALGWSRRTGELWRVFDDDGLQSRNYQDEARERGTWDLDGVLAKQLKGRYLNPTGAASAIAFRDLEHLLTLLRERGTEVVVLVTPVVPRVAEHWRANGFATRDRDIRSRIAALSARHGARFVDLSELDSFGGDPREFYDSIHPTVANTRRLVAALFPDGRGRD